MILDIMYAWIFVQFKQDKQSQKLTLFLVTTDVHLSEIRVKQIQKIIQFSVISKLNVQQSAELIFRIRAKYSKTKLKNIMWRDDHLPSKHKMYVVRENVGRADNNGVAGMKNMQNVAACLVACYLPSLTDFFSDIHEIDHCYTGYKLTPAPAFL